MSEFQIDLRKATLDDAQILLDWRNDEQTRTASINMDVVAYTDHIAWLEKTLENKDRHLYIGISQSENVGTIRADFDGTHYVLSWTVAPQKRGQGFGKELVGSVLTEFEGPFMAQIKKDNAASVKIAEGLCFKLQRKEDESLFYELVK